MGHKELFQALLKLNSYEAAGLEHFRVHGKYLDTSQFLYMYQHSQSHYPLEQLTSPKAVAEQQLLREQFRNKFGAELDADGIFTEGKSLEIEKLMRYINLSVHKHNFMEFAFVLSGTCKHSVGEYSHMLEKGSCSIIVPGVEHNQLPSPDCVCLTIRIKISQFDQMRIPNLPYFIYPICFQCGDDPFVYHTLLSIYEQQEMSRPYCDEIIVQLFQTMMVYIIQNYRDTLTHLALHLIQNNNAQSLEILSYIFDNYQTITLHALAEHFHFNASYLSNYIHQHFGQPFSSIVKEFKLKQAARLLLETNANLNEICNEVGYNNCSQFIRNFKGLYGITPIKYRKQHAETP